jgi:membrane protease YdiL (CAAX protease family)
MIGLSAGLVLLGNLKPWIAGGNPAGSPATAAFGMAVTGLALLWARRFGRLEAPDLGLGGRCALAGQVRAAAVGGGVGLACAGAVVALELGGVDRLGLRRYAPEVPAALLAMPAAQVLQRVLLYLPLDTVVPEEVAFRGVLLGALRRRVGWPAAVGLAAVPFALWHAVLALAETPSRNPTHLALKFAGYFLGGVGFGLLRPVTRTLAAPLAAHWTLNAALMLLLHPLGQRLARRGLVRSTALGTSMAKRARIGRA